MASTTLPAKERLLQMEARKHVISFIHPTEWIPSSVHENKHILPHAQLIGVGMYPENGSSR